MATTPPPQVRVHTPSTPLHGPRFDPSSSFSPRRSSRVAAQRSRAALSGSLSPSDRYNNAIESRSSIVNKSIASANLSPGFGRSGLQPFSPPLSPNSPFDDNLAGANYIRAENSCSKQTNQASGRKQRIGDELDDMDGFELPRETSTHTNFPPNMLPTPKKTPRKRRTQGDANASGILLAGRSLNIDDAMPSPRKSKRSKKQLGFTLQSFTTEDEDEAMDNTIPIYTDSKDRIPSLDQGEDNPFIGPPKVREKSTKDKRTKYRELETLPKARPQRQLRNSGKGAESDKHREDGMNYVFRGKKIFIKFDDVEEQDDGANFNGLDASDDLRRRIGHAATRPLRRASIKPRLLWPSKEDTQVDNNLEEEEAPTDIEEPDVGHSSEQNEIVEDTHEISSKSYPMHKAHKTDQSLSSLTHPSNRKSLHLHNGAIASSSSSTSRQSKRNERFSTFEGGSSAQGLVYKVSPFSSWTRTKAGQSSTSRTKGTKRDVDVTEPSRSMADLKRARSELDGDSAL